MQLFNPVTGDAQAACASPAHTHTYLLKQVGVQSFGNRFQSIHNTRARARRDVPIEQNDLAVHNRSDLLPTGTRRQLFNRQFITMRIRAEEKAGFRRITSSALTWG